MTNSSSVDHNKNIGNYGHGLLGARTAGIVTVGNRTWSGVSSTISNNIKKMS